MKKIHWSLALVLMVCASTGQTVLAQQNGKTVAQVKNTVITEEAYLDRVQHLRSNSFPQDSTLDAGGFILVGMIQDCLTDQLAVEKKFAPSDEQVMQFAQIVRRTTPAIEQEIVSQKMTEQDLYREVRKVIEFAAIGTEGAKANPTEVQKMYDEMKRKPIFAATYTIRALITQDSMKLKEVVPQLKASGDFKAAAKALNITGPQLAATGSEIVIPKEEAIATMPALTKALDALGNGPFTPDKGVFMNEPVAITAPSDPANPKAPARTIYVFAQLIGKQADETPPLDKIRPYLEIQALQHDLPQWQIHAQQQLTEYTKKALELNQIQIKIERYKSLLDSEILTRTNAPAEAPPTPDEDNGKPDKPKSNPPSKQNDPKQGKKGSG